MAVLS